MNFLRIDALAGGLIRTAGCLAIRRIIGLAALVVLANLGMPTVVFAHGGDATLIHACVNNKNKIPRIVDANVVCASNETPRHWAEASRTVSGESRITDAETKNLDQDTAIAALQAGSGAGNAIIVKDSQGQVVGRFMSYSDYGPPLVYRLFGDRLLAMVITGSQFLSTGVPYYYTTPDCSGTAYMLVGGLTEYVYTTDGVTGYYAGSPVQQIAIQSFGGISQTCQGPYPASILDVALPVLVDLSTLVTFPLHIE